MEKFFIKIISQGKILMKMSKNDHLFIINSLPKKPMVRHRSGFRFSISELILIRDTDEKYRMGFRTFQGKRRELWSRRIFLNKGISFLGIIDGAEHESDLRFLISYHLDKIMTTFTMKK
jgi:hypothetical protein